MQRFRGQCGRSLAQQVLNVEPKHGSLKSAGKRQESATFLQRSFFNVALQFFACWSAAFGTNDSRTAEKRMLQCNFRKLQHNFWMPLALRSSPPATGVIWALRAQSRKKNPKMGSRGLSASGVERIESKSKKRVQKSNSQILTLFCNFFDPQGREAPGTHFWIFFRLRARRAQMTPVAGEEDRNAGGMLQGWGFEVWGL